MIDGRIQEPKSDKQPAHDLTTEAGVFIPVLDIIGMLGIMYSFCITINALIYNKSL